MATYFEWQTNLSRGQDDATTKKKSCTSKVEYFRLEAGLLESVSVYADGLAYHSEPAAFRVPAGAQPSTASAYGKALDKAAACEKKRKEEAKAEKELRKKVDAMRKQLALLGKPAPAPGAGLLPVAKPSFIELVRERCEPVAPVEPALPLVPAPGLLDCFTVIDLEFQANDLLELAAIRYEQWEPVGEVVSFVQFRSPVWSPITQLTGITGLDVYDAPTEKSVLQRFKQLASDSLLVCHSIGADQRVLEAARTRQGATAQLPNPWLCTLALARKRLPKGTKCGLGELCQSFKIKARGAHRARRDAEMCFQVLRKLHALQPITKADLHGAPKPGKSSTQATVGLLFEAA